MCPKTCRQLFANKSMLDTGGTTKFAVQNNFQLDINNVDKWFNDNRLIAKCSQMS